MNNARIAVSSNGAGPASIPSSTSMSDSLRFLYTYGGEDVGMLMQQ